MRAIKGAAGALTKRKTTMNVERASIDSKYLIAPHSKARSLVPLRDSINNISQSDSKNNIRVHRSKNLAHISQKGNVVNTITSADLFGIKRENDRMNAIINNSLKSQKDIQRLRD